MPDVAHCRGQTGDLFAVRSLLSTGHPLEFVMLDLAIHRVGKLQLIRYTPRSVPGRMVQGPDTGPVEAPGSAPPGVHG